MLGTMSTCTRHNCTSTPLSGKEECILHADVNDKSISHFSQALHQYIKSYVEVNNGNLVIDNICFPNVFEFNDSLKANGSVRKIMKVQIKNCKLPHETTIKELEFDKFSLIGNIGTKLSLTKLKLNSALIVDNNLDSLEIDQSILDNLTFLTYCASGLTPPKMSTVFMILNEIKNFQIANQLFKMLHIASTKIYGTFTAYNLKSNAILIRESVFLSWTRFETIKTTKYFIFCQLCH